MAWRENSHSVDSRDIFLLKTILAHQGKTLEMGQFLWQKAQLLWHLWAFNPFHLINYHRERRRCNQMLHATYVSFALFISWNKVRPARWMRELHWAFLFLGEDRMGSAASRAFLYAKKPPRSSWSWLMIRDMDLLQIWRFHSNNIIREQSLGKTSFQFPPVIIWVWYLHSANCDVFWVVAAQSVGDWGRKAEGCGFHPHKPQYTNVCIAQSQLQTNRVNVLLYMYMLWLQHISPSQSIRWPHWPAQSSSSVSTWGERCHSVIRQMALTGINRGNFTVASEESRGHYCTLQRGIKPADLTGKKLGVEKGERKPA